MDNGKLESLVGRYIELDESIWKIVAIDARAALISNENGSNHQCRNVDTSICLAALVIDEDIELHGVGHFQFGK